MDFGKLEMSAGVWTKLDGFGDAEFNIARATDRSVLAGREKIIQRDYGRKYKSNNMRDIDQIDLGKKLAAEFILLDWRGITDDGKEVKYSVEQALKYFDVIQHFYAEVNAFSINDENYLNEEEVAKKSGKK